MPTPSTSSFSGDGNCLQKFGGGYVVNALECIGQNLLAEPIAISTPAGIIYIQPPFNAAKPGGGEQGDRLRGRDALRRERQKIAFYTRGFTKEMIGAFQRAVEDEKAGFGGDYALPDEELQAIRDQIRAQYGGG